MCIPFNGIVLTLLLVFAFVAGSWLRWLLDETHYWQVDLSLEDWSPRNSYNAVWCGWFMIVKRQSLPWYTGWSLELNVGG